MEFRQREVERLESDSSLSIGDVTTINLTSLNGGVQSNVVPPTLVAVFDMRLALSVDHDDYEKQVSQKYFLVLPHRVLGKSSNGYETFMKISKKCGT